MPDWKRPIGRWKTSGRAWSQKKDNAKATQTQIDELIPRAECFEATDLGAKHRIVARLIDRVGGKDRIQGAEQV